MVNYMPSKKEASLGIHDQKTENMEKHNIPDEKVYRFNRQTRISSGSKQTLTAHAPDTYTKTKGIKGDNRAIIVQCPVCERLHTLTGKDRHTYLKKIARKEMKFGKTCSSECAKKIAVPAFRKYHAKVVWQNYKEIELPKKPKGKKKPVDQNKRFEFTESKIKKMRRMLARID